MSFRYDYYKKAVTPITEHLQNYKAKYITLYRAGVPQ